MILFAGEWLFFIPPNASAECVAALVLHRCIVVGFVYLRLFRGIAETAWNGTVVACAKSVEWRHGSRRECGIARTAPVGKYLVGIAESADVILCVDLLEGCC